eukprot:gene57283-biopygen73352
MRASSGSSLCPTPQPTVAPTASPYGPGSSSSTYALLTQSMSPATASIAAPTPAAPRCTFSSAIVGGVDGHNIGNCRTGHTWAGCQQQCATNPVCESIDFALLDSGSQDTGRCCLGNCRIGDGLCVNNNRVDYQYSSCLPDGRVDVLAGMPTSAPMDAANGCSVQFTLQEVPYTRISRNAATITNAIPQDFCINIDLTMPPQISAAPEQT